MHSLTRYFMVIFAACSCLIATAVMPIQAEEKTTITVHPGNDHVFRGFGMNHTRWRDPYAQGMTQELIDSLLNLIYSPDEMGALYIRLFTHSSEYRDNTLMDATETGRTYGEIYQNIESIQPDIKFLFCPWQRGDGDQEPYVQDDLDAYVTRMVAIAKGITEEYGIEWSATGVFNEPQNDPELVDENHIVDLILKFRAELDEQGMQSTKIIAPECSNVLDWDPPDDPKGSHFAMLQKIAADATAYNTIDAWGYHSYDYGPSKWFRDAVRGWGDKELWQTESAMHGKEGDHREVHYAAQQAAIILSDLNLLASYWFFFNDFNAELYPYDMNNDDFQDALTLFKVTNRDGEGLKVYSYLKYDYTLRLARTFKPNTQMRLCTSDLKPYRVDGGTDIDTDRFTYMENTNKNILGEKSQVCAAGGRREDGSWAFAVVNRTGLPGVHADTVFNGEGGVAWLKHAYAPADSYEVTFDVEELAQSGDVEFTLTRCNPDVVKVVEGTVTMQNGTITVMTAPTDLVTLESAADIPYTATLDGSGRIRRNTLFNARKIGSEWILTAGSYSVDQGIATAEIFNAKGRMVRRLTSKPDAREQVTLRWDGLSGTGAPVAAGTYTVRYKHADFTAQQSITLVD